MTYITKFGTTAGQQFLKSAILGCWVLASKMSEETAPEEKPSEVEFVVRIGIEFFYHFLISTVYFCVILAHRGAEVGTEISGEQETSRD